jgi:hypothetical protein
VSIDAGVISHWDTYASTISGAIQSNPEATQQLLRVTGASIDPTNPSSVAETVLGVLEYDVFSTNDAVEKLGGSPYDNRFRWYSGSDNDILLNRNIQRFSASNTALAAISQGFQTSGHLQRPLVTIHTTGDPIIPYWQETIYSLKVLLAGSLLQHVNIPVLRYGHCTFNQTELLNAFSLLVFMAGL